MRPAKNILLYCSDEDRRMELAYMLYIRGRYPIYDLDIPSAPDIALVIHDSGSSEWAASHIAKRFPESHLLVLLPTFHVSAAYPPQSRCLRSDSPAQILDWVHLAAVRKRGPKIQRRPVSGQTNIDALGVMEGLA